jgi:hypothetical protein
MHVIASGSLVGLHVLYTILVWTSFPAAEDGSAIRLWRQVEETYRRFALAVMILSVVSGALLLRFTLISPELYHSTPYGRLLEIKVGCILVYGFMGTLMPRAHSRRDGGSSPTARGLSLLNLLALLGAAATGYLLRYV